MRKADNYITENSYVLSFDKKSAKTTMSDHEIKIIKDFVKMQNDYVDKVKKNPNIKHSFDSETENKFSELKKQIKESKNKIKYTDYISDWILPEAFAWTDVCGGSFDNPHPEYIRKEIYSISSKSAAISIVENWGYVRVPEYASSPSEWFNSNSLDYGKEIYSISSKSAAISIVENWGYVRVPEYASSPSEWFNSNSLDYGKEISAYNCNFRAFRDQIVLDNDGRWDFNKQIKEPNPSFLDYYPPVWWWIWYTGVWHADEIGKPTQW